MSGNETLMREASRSVWLPFGFESIIKDWRDAWRGLRRSPAFTVLVASADPAALGGAVLLLMVVALIATLVPVRRALRIDPMDALRTD